MNVIRLGLTLLAAPALLWGAQASAKVATGDNVSDMTVVDTQGVTHKLSDFAGKKVVLEWTNHGCPFVKKHYNAKYSNMQNLQKLAAADDVVWLSIISSAPGEQGYVNADQANALTVSRGANPSAVILDPKGDAGRTFSAKTTPHMFVIDADQTLVYQGAIDSNSSVWARSIPGATNYVQAALDDLKAGNPVSTAETAPYGCSVKYNS